ncbi:ALF repeat-containing protein [Streptomyces sp. NPDC006530]|uniref:ALF repeat-containing protein n=1 Tax=Streptomyces sp. NPDC006530 TaxID=3364750 RepID=UPI0036C1835F
MDAMKTRGPWVSQAGADALGGSDQDVITFLRTGWDTAVQDETRDAVSELSTNSPYESARTAAARALEGAGEEESERLPAAVGERGFAVLLHAGATIVDDLRDGHLGLSGQP